MLWTPDPRFCYYSHAFFDLLCIRVHIVLLVAILDVLLRAVIDGFNLADLFIELGDIGLIERLDFAMR